MEQLATLSLPLAAPSPGPDALDRLLARAPSSDPQLADAVTRALEALPAHGEAGTALLGKRLLALLDTGRLRGLVCTDGSTCEVHASKRLLELGYPWALHLTPRQLEAVRELRAPAPSRPRRLAFTTSAVAVGLDVFPLLFAWMSWVNADAFAFGGLYQLLSLGALVVNLLFARGRLGRAPATAISSAALAVSGFGFELAKNFEAMVWGWLAAAWLVTLLAARLAGAPAQSRE